MSFRGCLTQGTPEKPLPPHAKEGARQESQVGVCGQQAPFVAFPPKVLSTWSFVQLLLIKSSLAVLLLQEVETFIPLQNSSDKTLSRKLKHLEQKCGRWKKDSAVTKLSHSDCREAALTTQVAWQEELGTGHCWAKASSQHRVAMATQSSLSKSPSSMHSASQVFQLLKLRGGRLLKMSAL
jgi:hypothetical protein